MKLIAICCAIFFAFFGLEAAYADWKTHANWCQQDYNTGGSVECPGEFITAGAGECIAFGGRACLVIKMRGVAISGVPGACRAAQIGLSVCQCHNGGARQEILNAPTDEVCNYLRN